MLKFSRKACREVLLTRFNMPAGASYTSPKEDPRRPTKIFRYKPVTSKPTDDPTAEYMNLLGMIFSMCGLLMKVCGASHILLHGLIMFFVSTASFYNL